jgi:capsular polysaccharide biosynthesis protein
LSEGEITEGKLDLRIYWQIFQRRWWVIALSVVGVTAAAFIMSNSITPIYDATAKVLVQGGQAPGIPSASEIQASQQLANNYRDLIKTRPILDKVIDSLALPYSAASLFAKISVTNPRSLIEIMASDPDPEMASQIANATAEIFIEDFRDRQLTEIAQFQASLGQYGISIDAGVISAQATTLSSLSVAEPAISSSSPSSPNTKLDVILAAISGLLLGVILVMLVEHMDDRIKSTDELERMTDLRATGSPGLS